MLVNLFRNGRRDGWVKSRILYGSPNNAGGNGFNVARRLGILTNDIQDWVEF